MACITERTRAGKPSVWQAVIRIKGHPAVIQTFKTKSEAEQFAAEVESSLRKNLNSSSAKLQKLRRKIPGYQKFYERPLRDVIKDFAYGPLDPETGARATIPALKKIDQSQTRPKKKREPAHLPQLGGGLRDCVNTVLDNIGAITVGEATKSWVARYVDKMRAKASVRSMPFSYGTIIKHLHLMRAACLAAALRADIDEPRLHFSAQNFPKNWKGSRDRRLEFGEHHRIMETLGRDRSVKGRHFRCLYRLALETGARLQELALAEWTEFAHQQVWVIPAGHTKKNTARKVSLSPRARRILTMLRAMSISASKFVFHTFGTISSVSKRWAHRMAHAGIENLRFHDLRHEAISRMIVHPANVRFETIQEMVGHRSAEMTAKYTHLRLADYVGLFDASPTKPQ